MKPGQAQGAISLPLVIALIVAGALILSLIFFSLFQKLDVKVENTVREQFNQQQLMLARKIADNVESYFDYLENELLAFPWRFRNIQPDYLEFDTPMAKRFSDLQRLGILEVLWFDRFGQLVRHWGGETPGESGQRAVRLSEPYLKWIEDPQNKGHLLLGKVKRWPYSPWQGRLVMPLISPLYSSEDSSQSQGALELLIDPLFICSKVTRDVRSGKTGYAWIINQDGVLLAHYEKDFIGQDAIRVHLARNPKLTYEGLRELQNKIFRGEEGTTEYVTGWHRQRIGRMVKLAAFTPIRFDRGLIRNVTEVEDKAHNLWGVAVVAPMAEVSGRVSEVLHQELFLAGMFFLVIISASGILIGVALTFNKRLSREVALKTREIEESHDLLVRSERFAAVGQAAAYVSHEIKNPLMVIGGLAQQVGRHLDQEPQIQEKLSIIQGEVRRLENFLGDLRDFTRPAVPSKESINLNQVIHEVQALMEGEAQKRGINISEHLDPQLPRVEADPSQMKQVLLNLLKNGLEAMDSGGEITLKSGAEDRQVWFSVHDSGPGMPPEMLDKIFNPFFTTKEKGTGLGLAVIHKIITDHQGTVKVKSEPEQGTTFVVRLPCQD